MQTQRFVPIAVLAGLLLVAGSCQPESGLPVEHAKERIKNHFEREKYAGVVELVSVEFDDQRVDNLYGSDYLDLLFTVTIDVQEGHVMSTMFMPGTGFEVNHNWPLVRQQRLENAPDEQSREEVRAFYDDRIFSAGEHTIKSLVTYGILPDDQYTFMELSMDASSRQDD